MLKTVAVIMLALAAAATQSSAIAAHPASKHRATAGHVMSAGAKRGLVFAEQRCSACHSVTVNRSSPNPESPPFEDIANRPGVTGETLEQFLRDSHNYPEAMNFKVEAARIRDLATYMVTMKKAGYRPVM